MAESEWRRLRLSNVLMKPRRIDCGSNKYSFSSCFLSVLPRIYYLFQHLASQAVIHNSVEQRGSDPTAAHMARTAARLLNAVPDSNLLDCILRDLVYLTKDLSVLYESGLLKDNDNNNAATNAVEAALFQETVERSDWTLSSNIPEYSLRIPSEEALLSVQGATLLMIENFVTIRKERRLLILHQHTDALGGVLEELDESYLTVGDPDLYFGILQSDDDCIRALLMSLRQNLLAGMAAERDLAKTSPDSVSLMLLSNRSAIQILLQLHTDWNRSGVPTFSLLQETALLVAESAVKYLRTSSILAAGRSLRTDLARLVHAFVLAPPFVQGSMTRSAAEISIHGTTAATIFESVRYMPNTVESDGAPTKIATATERESRVLEIVLLRSIHATMLSLQASSVTSNVGVSSSLSMQLMLTRDVVAGLFGSLNDPILSNSVALTLSHLMCPDRTARSRLSEIEDIAKSCLQSPIVDCDDALQGSWSQSSSNETSGMKRKSNPDNRAADLSMFSVATTQRKRQKIFTDWSHKKSLSFFDDMLSILFQQALRSAAGIREVVGGGGQGFHDDQNLLDSLLLDVGLAFGVIKLLVSSSRAEDLFSTTVCPHFVQLSAILFEALSTLGSILVSTYKTIEENTRHIKSVADAFISCGAFAEIVVNGTEDLPPAFAEFLSKARDLYCMMDESRRSFGFSLRLPMLLQETIMASSMRMFTRNQTSRRVVPVFGDLLTVSTGSVDNAEGHVFPIAPALFSVVSKQFDWCDHLELLVARLGEKWHRPDNLLQYTYDRVHSLIDSAHSDPGVRLLVWQCVAWMFTTTSQRDFRLLLRSDKPRENTSDPTRLTIGNRLVYFLIDVAFADPDPTLRDFASREIGKVLLEDDCGCLVAAMANDDEWQQLRGNVNASSAGVRQASEQVKSRLFLHVDSILHKRCSVPQSQLSFAMASKQPTSPRQDSQAATSASSFRRSASRALCSLCETNPSHTYVGRLLFEHAMIRVVRMWSGIDTAPRFESMGVCFAELSRLFILQGSDLPLNENMRASFAPAIFRDILVPGSSLLVGGASDDGIASMTNSFRERQFDLLSTFLRASLVQNWSQTSVSTANDGSDLERCLESCLPYVISQLIVEKDYDALCLTSAYKLYLLGLKRLEHKRRKRSGTSYLESEPAAGLIVGEASLFFAKSSSSRQWSRNLEDQTRQLCLAPGLIERIIPLVFMRAGRAELIFFTKDVLQDKLSLKQLVTSREMLTLKNFVLELGRNPEMTGSVVRAMETAAVARNQETGANLGSVSSSTSVTVERNGNAAVTAWVTTHFMYLLVNVVQFRWTTKTDDLRIQALRSLVAIIDFLRSSEAPQYLPQIMATVNAALSYDPDDVKESQLGSPLPRLQMRMFAVQVLAKFVKLIAETQKSIIGQNLTSIVVSLIPILSDDEQRLDTYNSSIVEESRSCAVALLEFLTQGHLGMDLAKSFKDIPFLPPSSALDSVRASLRSLGVHFDNLQVASTQGTQQDVVPRSGMSDNGSASVDSRGSAITAARQTALRKRLGIVCSLLGNENASVRQVVLQHLAALLRANRELFHALVENENTTSMKRYLTVPYPGRKGT